MVYMCTTAPRFLLYFKRLLFLSNTEKKKTYPGAGTKHVIPVRTSDFDKSK